MNPKVLLPVLAAMAMSGTEYGSGNGSPYSGIGIGTVKKWQPSNSGIQTTLTPKQRKARAMSKIQKRSRKINRK